MPARLWAAPVAGSWAAPIGQDGPALSPPAPAGPSVRDITTGTGAGGTRLFTLPTRVVGDTLIAVVANDAGVNRSANTNWTRRVNTDDGVAIGLAFYTRQSDGTDNVPVVSNMSGAYTYTIFAVKDVVTGYNAAAGTSSFGTPAASIVAPSIAPSAAPAVLVSAYLRSLGSGTITPPVGQAGTTAVAVAGHTLRCGYESLAASGATGTRTATGSSAVEWCSGSVAVK